ncbi:MAG: 2-oxoglutarate dehydrogenase E1 component [Arsenophonus sp.]|nr:MAG: 2-oxoglutarate dehydrogenase E1 component [Arsenophonus sp.]
MQNGILKKWLNTSFLSSINFNYIESLYEQYLLDSGSVEPEWVSIFQEILNHSSSKEYFYLQKQKKYFIETKNNKKRLFNNHVFMNSDHKSKFFDSCQLNIYNFINAYRSDGHKNASLDPLNLKPKQYIPSLDLSSYNLHKIDFNKEIDLLIPFLGFKKIKFNNLYDQLRKIYCSSIGFEYMHLSNENEKNWIQSKLEQKNSIDSCFSKEEKVNFLSHLIFAEGLEHYLGVHFPGAKRFSLEGADSIIPMLKDLLNYSSSYNTKEVILGMAHRGRLNVLINIFGKPSKDLFNEFAGKYTSLTRSGDVKYHQGYSSDIQLNNKKIHLVLAYNPSHLEIVNPVVMGSTRARFDRSDNKKENNILSVTIHGDSAVVGQGVVQETLNMSQTRAYKVGGTIRIVINNQIGFTTSNIKDSRSTLYCTDVMKMIEAPIFHVNGDDIESVIFVTRLAIDFRNKFNKDVIIDLVCYRRYGHNEADEPSATQPIMYQKIKHHKTTAKIYADQLILKKIINQTNIDKIVNNYRKKLDNSDVIVDGHISKINHQSIWTKYLNIQWDHSYENKIDKKRLRNLGIKLNTIPKNIVMHPRVKKIYDDRLDMAIEKKLFDWGAAETLAYASLLDAGIKIRISGEDTRRGTFFHRHAVIYNQIDGSSYIPLNQINKTKKLFNIWDSVLSEEAALAFEYGYASTDPQTLVIWEAQFGDFSNGAQVVIDQFISSGEQKWGKMCGLVMLLPHGYEGQGPEHSSARIERFLQLCAEDNIQVCVPSTPAQFYHVLRRQILRSVRRPLILITPKSLLRHPNSVSKLEDLSVGRFHSVIIEENNLNLKDIKRVIFCTGKIYYDLIEERKKRNQNNIIIIRIEELYPFPKEILKKVLISYMHIRDFLWCQEEPLNQGAFYYVRNYISKIIPNNVKLSYCGRPASSSPAVGYIKIHQKQQNKLIQDALNIN